MSCCQRLEGLAEVPSVCGKCLVTLSHLSWACRVPQLCAPVSPFLCSPLEPCQQQPPFSPSHLWGPRPSLLHPEHHQPHFLLLGGSRFLVPGWRRAENRSHCSGSRYFPETQALNPGPRVVRRAVQTLCLSSGSRASTFLGFSEKPPWLGGQVQEKRQKRLKEWASSTRLSSLVAQAAKNLPATQETQVRYLSREDSLEWGMATHSSVLAWKISGTEEPGGLLSMGSQRLRQDWVTNSLTFTPQSGSLWSRTAPAAAKNEHQGLPWRPSG